MVNKQTSQPGTGDNMKITDIDDYREHIVAETICVKCGHRAIAVFQDGILLKDLECEKCGAGFIILTGENLNE